MERTETDLVTNDESCPSGQPKENALLKGGTHGGRRGGGPEGGG